MEANEIKTMNRIDITIRARPIIPNDSDKNLNNESSNFEDRAVDINEPEGQVIVALDKTFQFDNAFDGDTSQATIYRASVSPLIDKFVGQCDNVSILAYGQTGSGKTYTMMGDVETDDFRGMIPRSIKDVFAQVDEITDSLSVSFFEIYNEKLYDLLGTNKAPLTIREEYNRFSIRDLSSYQVRTCDQTLDYLKKGNKSRSTASTRQNETSSRSHAVFTITLKRTIIKTINSCKTTNCEKLATLHLVDLAGSESVRKTEAAGERLTEGSNINKGLLSLGNCISDICAKKVHIPYRDSVLTKVLRESLQDGGWTGMIICISPTEHDMNETINTLRYANRAKELTKPPVPKYLLKEAEAQKRKNRYAGVHIPPTPAHWKRPHFKMNNTIETPTPSKRLKMMNGSRVDTAHSFTFATPNETPSDLNKKPMNTGHSVNKNNFLATAVKRNMDKLLQDIEEETCDTNQIDDTLKSGTSPPFGSEISCISPYAENSKTVTTIRKEVLTNMASPNLRKELLKNNAAANNTTNVNNVTMIDVTNLSPMIRRITDQVCQQFEQRCSRMEENLRQQFESTFSTCRRSPRIFEKTVKETPTTVRKQILSERNNLNSKAILSETLGIGGSPEEIVSGMAFPEVRQEMRENQNLLYKNAQNENCGRKASELISFKKPNKFSQVKMNHLNKVAPTASPLLSKTPKRVRQILENKENDRRTSFNLTPRRSSPKGSNLDGVVEPIIKSPTLEEMERTLGINPDSPGIIGLFGSEQTTNSHNPVANTTKCEARGPKRSTRRTTMMSSQLNQSLRQSGIMLPPSMRIQPPRAIRRSIRLSEKVTTAKAASQGCSDGEFKQPFEVKDNWKIRNQEKHNARLLGLLNSANLKMLQSIPAIGPKTAYILLEHRELHNGFSSFEDLKTIPGLQKNFYAKFLKTHQIV